MPTFFQRVTEYAARSPTIGASMLSAASRCESALAIAKLVAAFAEIGVNKEALEKRIIDETPAYEKAKVTPAPVSTDAASNWVAQKGPSNSRISY